jgi:hypothetical protein
MSRASHTHAIDGETMRLLGRGGEDHCPDVQSRWLAAIDQNARKMVSPLDVPGFDLGYRFGQNPCHSWFIRFLLDNGLRNVPANLFGYLVGRIIVGNWHQNCEIRSRS